jgi:hypothetical protein
MLRGLQMHSDDITHDTIITTAHQHIFPDAYANGMSRTSYTANCPTIIVRVPNSVSSNQFTSFIASRQLYSLS